VQLRQWPTFPQNPGAGAAHELSLAPHSGRRQFFARAGIEAARRAAQTAGRQPFQPLPQFGRRNPVGRRGLFQFLNRRGLFVTQRPHPQADTFPGHHRRRRRRRQDSLLVLVAEGPCFDNLRRSQINRAHLDCVGAQHSSHISGFPVADPAGQDQGPAGKQFGTAFFQYECKLGQCQRAVNPDMSAGLAALANYLPVAVLQGQLQQILGRRDVDSVNSGIKQRPPLGGLAGGNHGETRTLLPDPFQLGLAAGILRQSDDIDRIRPIAHHFPQIAKLPLQGVRIHQPQGQGRQPSRRGDPGCEFRRVADPGHSALNKRESCSPEFGYRAVGKPGGDFSPASDNVPYRRLEATAGLRQIGTKLPYKLTGKARFDTERN